MNIIKFILSSFKFRKKKLTMTSAGFVNITSNEEIKNYGDLQVIFHKDGEGCFFAMICPKCKDISLITARHTKTFDLDGKITIHPSILHRKCGAHYYVIKNEILLI